MGSAPDKYRIQLDFTPEAFKELERLKADVEASSRADTVRYAMRVLRWVINALRRGDQIVIHKANGDTVEVQFPFLPSFEPSIREIPVHEKGKDYMHVRGRQAREQGSQWVEQGREALKQQRDKFRSAYEAGRQAYDDTTAEQRDEQNP